jgi:cytochrome c oxidase cbb3-type subunit I
MAKSVSDLSSVADLPVLAVPSSGAGVKAVEKDATGNATPEVPSVILTAAWHSLAWLFVANMVGVWLAVLLLYPSAGRWLGEWSYGRWTPVHLNFQLYGWMSLPLVAWAMRIYRADRGAVAIWSRTALLLWSLSLTLGAFSWLNGNSSGKLFLDWTGYVRVVFPLSILFLWAALALACKRTWRDADHRSPLARMAKLIGLAVLVLVPFLIYIASDPTIYPAVNPDTGGPTGASQLESTLIIVLILFLLPYGLAHRKGTGRKWIVTASIIFTIEAMVCLALGRQDVSHHRPVQFISLASLLVWVPLVPAYFSAFEWPLHTRRWRQAVMVWWALLVPTGWALFLPGILDRLKFTDGLVGHSIMAMAGFVSSLLILILAVLLGEDGNVFNSRWAFVAWHGATLAYVALFLLAGWREGADAAFTIVPGLTRNLLYDARLVLGLAMTGASAHWLMRLTLRMRYRKTPVPHPFVAFQAKGWETNGKDAMGIHAPKAQRP